MKRFFILQKIRSMNICILSLAYLKWKFLNGKCPSYLWTNYGIVYIVELVKSLFWLTKSIFKIMSICYAVIVIDVVLMYFIIRHLYEFYFKVWYLIQNYISSVVYDESKKCIWMYRCLKNLLKNTSLLQKVSNR